MHIDVLDMASFTGKYMYMHGNYMYMYPKHVDTLNSSTGVLCIVCYNYNIDITVRKHCDYHR